MSWFDDNFDGDWRAFAGERRITCTRCGKRGLFWATDDQGKWYLQHKNGNRHVCNPDHIARETAKFFDSVK